MEATKPKWRLNHDQNTYHVYINDADDKAVCILDGRVEERLVNGVLIVRAVNTFDQAREALQTAKEALVYTGFCCGDNCIDEIDQALAAMEATS